MGRSGDKSYGHKPDSPPQMSLNERAIKIVSLRASGATWAQCAKAVGYASPSAAQRSAQKWINRQQHEDRKLMRQIEGARYDRLQLALWPRALQGDVQAIDKILKISAARREMFGLNAPTRVVIEDSFLDAEIRDLADELGVPNPRDLVEIAPVTPVAALEGAAPPGDPGDSSPELAG